MSSEVKAKRRKNKKSSPALKFTSRFRIAQPGEQTAGTQSNEGPSPSAPPAKFFHWKYDDADTSVQDDGTAPPVYGRRAPLGKSDSPSTLKSSSGHLKDQIASPTRHSGHARQWLQDMQPEEIMRRQIEAQEMQMRSQHLLQQQHQQQQHQQNQQHQQQQQQQFMSFGVNPIPLANKVPYSKAELFAYQFQGISPHQQHQSQSSSSANPIAPLLRALEDDDAMDVDEPAPSTTPSGRRSSLALQHVLLPTTEHLTPKFTNNDPNWFPGMQHPSAEKSALIGPSQHSAFKPAGRRANQPGLFLKSETMMSGGSS